jgi:hypothetical protein
VGEAVLRPLVSLCDGPELKKPIYRTKYKSATNKPGTTETEVLSAQLSTTNLT